MTHLLFVTILITQCNTPQTYPQTYYNQQFYNQQYATFVAVEDYYPDIVGQQLRYDEANRLSSSKDAKIDEILLLLKQMKLTPGTGNPGTGNPGIDPPLPVSFKPVSYIKPVSVRRDEDVPPPPQPIEPVNIPDNISTIFKSNCFKCHSGTSIPSMNLFTLNNNKLSLSSNSLLLKISNVINTNKMPKKGTPLSINDKTIINEWVARETETIVLSMR